MAELFLLPCVPTLNLLLGSCSESARSLLNGVSQLLGQGPEDPAQNLPSGPLPFQTALPWVLHNPACASSHLHFTCFCDLTSPCPEPRRDWERLSNRSPSGHLLCHGAVVAAHLHCLVLDLYHPARWYYFCFTAGKANTQRGEETCPRTHS